MSSEAALNRAFLQSLIDSGEFYDVFGRLLFENKLDTWFLEAPWHSFLWIRVN